MDYKGVWLEYNNEEWRIDRLKNIIDEINATLQKEEINQLEEIEDDKGTIKLYWKEKITNTTKILIDIICYDDNDACNVKNYILNLNNQPKICSCHKPPQKEDEEIKKYIKSLTI